MAASPAELGHGKASREQSSLWLVVIAGGSGTRFWPKSTSKRPKQLISFEGGGKETTLLAKTFSRFDGVVSPKHRMVVTTEALAQACRENVPGVEVLAEPKGRNTAPCVYWAARAVAARNPEAVMLVMPADHHIGAPDRFRETVKQAAARAASKDELVTLGVKPTRPETGYGYLRVGGSVGGECRKVDAFVEKPDLEKAQRFLAEGNYLWNGGMFLWRASTILAAFDHHMPEMKKAWEAAGGDAIRAYPNLTATSIDFGVMEKASNVVTFTLDCDWDDLGSWTSLEDLGERTGRKTADGTVLSGELLSVDGGGHIVDVPGKKLVATLGVDDLIIVESGDSILIAHKDRAQDIRLVVEKLKSRRPELA